MATMGRFLAGLLLIALVGNALSFQGLWIGLDSREHHQKAVQIAKVSFC